MRIAFWLVVIDFLRVYYFGVPVWRVAFELSVRQFLLFYEFFHARFWGVEWLCALSVGCCFAFFVGLCLPSAFQLFLAATLKFSVSILLISQNLSSSDVCPNPSFRSCLCSPVNLLRSPRSLVSCNYCSAPKSPPLVLSCSPGGPPPQPIRTIFEIKVFCWWRRVPVPLPFANTLPLANRISVISVFFFLRAVCCPFTRLLCPHLLLLLPPVPPPPH